MYGRYMNNYILIQTYMSMNYIKIIRRIVNNEKNGSVSIRKHPPSKDFYYFS